MAMGTYFGYAPRRTNLKGRNYKYRTFPKVNKTVKKYVKQVVRRDKELNDVETKDQTNITTEGRFVLLNATGQSVSPEGHLGREINSVSIQSLGSVSNSDTVPHKVRIVFFIDNASNGAAPTEGQLFNTAEFQLPEEGGLPNQDYKKRFTIIRDMFFNLNPIGESGSERIIKYFRKLVHKVIYTEESSTSITSITKGALYCYLASTGTTTDVTCMLSHLYKFTE